MVRKDIRFHASAIELWYKCNSGKWEEHGYNSQNSSTEPTLASLTKTVKEYEPKLLAKISEQGEYLQRVENSIDNKIFEFQRSQRISN